jgi:hypothetical protein
MKRNIMGAGPMGINHFFGCAVIMGVLLQTSFSSHAQLSESCTKKIALTVSQGSKITRGKTLSAFQTAMRKLTLKDSYGDQVFCESSRKCGADDVFHPSQNIYTIDREKGIVFIFFPSGVLKQCDHGMMKNQIERWLSIKERDTYFPWWELPSQPSRYDIQCWCKRVCHDKSLVYRNLVYFAHTKHEGDEQKLHDEKEKCIIRYHQKLDKETTKTAPVCKKRKQQRQRKLLHDSMDSHHTSDFSRHFVDHFSFGYASEDGTMVSLGDLSGCTPIDWFVDEAVHTRILPPSAIYNVGETSDKKKSKSKKNKQNRKQKAGTGESLIDILELAHSAWEDRYGSSLKITFSQKNMHGHQMHIAQCDGIYQYVNESKTSKWIFPDCEKHDENGIMCFPKIKIAKHAFLWHVLVNVSSHSWRNKWIGSLMLRDGIHNSTILKERRRRRNLVTVSVRDNEYIFGEVSGRGEWGYTNL